MTIRHPFRHLLIGVPTLLGLMAGCEPESHPFAGVAPDVLHTLEAPVASPVVDPLTVMTRNLYHGGDIAPVLAVGFSDLELLTETAAGVWAEVQANDFHERVVALVDEIEAANPDIVGLQELAEFVTFALNPATGSFVETGGIDFEAILEEELTSRGLPYSMLAVQPNTVVQVPVAGMDMGGTFIPTQLVKLAVRDGVLARNDLIVESVSQANYGVVVPLGVDPFGNPIEMKRGWIRVDADVGGVPHHFISTHMEIQPFAPFQLLHAEELLTEVVGDPDGVTILMGDFNSNAAGSEGDESWTPTYQMVLDAGFTDLWAMTHPGNALPGLTCCHASDLLNPMPTFYQRIDFIFLKADALKGPDGHLPGVATVELVGDDPGLKTVPSGLWASDHAGLVADLGNASVTNRAWRKEEAAGQTAPRSSSFPPEAGYRTPPGFGAPPLRAPRRFGAPETVDMLSWDALKPGKDGAKRRDGTASGGAPGF